jgi:hypothetical protein
VAQCMSMWNVRAPNNPLLKTQKHGRVSNPGVAD